MPSFPLFTHERMPLEIQDLIWKHAISAIPSRIIELSCKVPDTILTESGDIEHVFYDHVSNASIPAVLHACTRSRLMAQNRWTLTFPSRYYHANRQLAAGRAAIPRVWFDFEGDTLLFLFRVSRLAYPVEDIEFHFYRTINLETRSRIRNVGYSLENLEVYESAEYDDEDEILKFKVLVQWLDDTFPKLRTLFALYTDLPFDRKRSGYDLIKGFRELKMNEQWEKDEKKMIQDAYDERRGVGEVEVRLVEFYPISDEGTSLGIGKEWWHPSEQQKLLDFLQNNSRGV